MGYNAAHGRYVDIGVGGISTADLSGFFQTPALRNVARTAPYMHDGRFGSLEAVLDFYDHGVVDSPNLDEKLRQNGQLGIPMKEAEKTAIIAFLQTLTDTIFLNDERFSEY